jgi:hypothetical protein
MTQGILSTKAVTKYALKPRKQLGLTYDGAILGTVGTSMAVAGNAAAANELRTAPEEAEPPGGHPAVSR